MEYINYKDKLYYIYRRVREGNIKPELISELKDFWNCDLVIKNKNTSDVFLLYLREIEDAKLV